MLSAEWTASILAVLMVVQAPLELFRPNEYRDVAWIKATWYGNDWITLAAAVRCCRSKWRRPVSDRCEGLLVLGMAGDAIYNYAFYSLVRRGRRATGVACRQPIRGLRHPKLDLFCGRCWNARLLLRLPSSPDLGSRDAVPSSREQSSSGGSWCSHLRC